MNFSIEFVTRFSLLSRLPVPVYIHDLLSCPLMKIFILLYCVVLHMVYIWFSKIQQLMYKCNKMFSCYFRCYKRCSHTWESRFIMHAVLESRCKTNVMSHRHAVFPKAHSSLFSVPVKEITFPQSKENINPDCERTMTHC